MFVLCFCSSQKLINDFKTGRTHSCFKERILKEFDASLARLQLSYVDIIQIHDFEFCQVFSKLFSQLSRYFYIFSYKIPTFSEPGENCTGNSSSAGKDCGKRSGQVNL